MIGIIPAAGRAERMGGIPKYLLPTPEGSLIDVLSFKIGSVIPKIVILTTQTGRDLLWNRQGVRVVNTQTMSETVLCVHDHSVSTFLGLPDTYFEEKYAFEQLKNALEKGADVAVGVFETRPEQRSKLGMCLIHEDRVSAVIDKPEETTLTYAWGVLAWKPEFWQFIKASDPHVGYALPRAIGVGMDVRAVPMRGQYFDCGDYREYFSMIRYLTEGIKV